MDSPTPAPSPAPSFAKSNSTRNGNGISTHSRPSIVSSIPKTRYTLDGIKKKRKTDEALLKSRVSSIEANNKVLAARVEELKRCDTFLTGLNLLANAYMEASIMEENMMKEVEHWEKRVERWEDMLGPLQDKDKGGEANTASEDEEDLESGAENEFEAWDADKSGNEALDEMEEEPAVEEVSDCNWSDDEKEPAVKEVSDYNWSDDEEDH